MLINPRPGVVVATTDRFGDIACYDPNAYRRRDYIRNKKILEAEKENEDEPAESGALRKAGVLLHQ